MGEARKVNVKTGRDEIKTKKLISQFKSRDYECFCEYL